MAYGLKACSCHEWHKIARTAIPSSFFRNLHLTYSKEKMNLYSVVMLYTELEHRFFTHRVDIYVLIKLYRSVKLVFCSFICDMIFKNYIDTNFKCQVCVWWGVWVHISNTYQFLSASFRNLTNATKHSPCVTCGSQWSVKLEEVAHSFLRVIPYSQTGFWTEFWLDILVFFFWRVNART